ncbi:MAG: phosphatidylserine/phosphatidylglycerophosphate/cardiolipin synthase [Mycobacterium sp.]|nr:phosphatidylserine/phosphatidylglycerophosphate/cardiolipin synthase [Mycobacterium sp.]
MQPNAPGVIVQPDDGVEPVRAFIASAAHTLLIKQFTFTDETLIEAVIDRRRAGVDVRVMLNAKRSGGDRANDDTFARLGDAGIDVKWANPLFYVTHEKSIVVDGTAALVATFNLCEKYFTRTRDYGVVTVDPAQIAQITEVFDADWNEADWQPSPCHGLLWSNANSRLHMARFIDTATRRIDVQHPKYVDAVILDHLAAAADRGVKVHVLCGGRHGISEWDVLDTFASLRTLRRFGVKVHKQKNLRVHAKLIIVDDERALVGSMNIDRSAFDLRRELGITTSDPMIVKRLKAVFDEDWELSHHYSPPDPLHPELHHDDDASDFPSDSTLVHE